MAKSSRKDGKIFREDELYVLKDENFTMESGISQAKKDRMSRSKKAQKHGMCEEAHVARAKITISGTCATTLFYPHPMTDITNPLKHV